MPNFKHRWRFAMIQFAWLSALLLTVYAIDFTVRSMALAAAIGFVIVIVTTLLFDWERVQQAWQPATRRKQKRKHDALDTLLRKLSDDELEMLRQRLQDATIDDEMLRQRIAHDDEKLMRHG